MNETFMLNVKIHIELLKYKEDFANAIKVYHDRVMVEEDYENYVSDGTKVSCRLRCDYKASYYKTMLENTRAEIQTKAKGGKTKVSDSVLINNVLASLKEISYFN